MIPNSNEGESTTGCIRPQHLEKTGGGGTGIALY
jgi:hypothetical protein